MVQVACWWALRATLCKESMDIDEDVALVEASCFCTMVSGQLRRFLDAWVLRVSGKTLLTANPYPNMILMVLMIVVVRIDV